ncbi:MAG: methionine--tRNA ligase subunit beta, partial [Bacteroidales bacterium]
MPETKDNDFTWKDFQNRNNNELVAILGNFVNRALVLTHKYFDGKVPACGELTDYDKETLAEIPTLKASIEKNLDAFRFRDALRETMNVARLGNKYLADSEPWKLFKNDPERVATILNVALQITANITILAEPFLPFTTQKLSKMINVNNLGWNNTGKTDLLSVGHEIGKSKLLFEKIEDEVVQKQLDKLMATKEQNKQDNKQIEPQKDTITYDDFMRMDVRIGTILSAEKVAKTQKLLKLEIDTGLDKRTVVSGIAEYFKPEDIVGKQVSILVNLEPRKIRGILSHGMILMAQDADGSLRFVEPNEAVCNGAEVK